MGREGTGGEKWREMGGNCNWCVKSLKKGYLNNFFKKENYIFLLRHKINDTKRIVTKNCF